MHMNAKAMPNNNTDYSSHIKLLELFNQPYGVHIMPLLINSLLVHTHNTHTGTHKHMHTHIKLTYVTMLHTKSIPGTC